MAILRPFLANFFANYVFIFHKTEIQRVILRFLTILNRVKDEKSYKKDKTFCTFCSYLNLAMPNNTSLVAFGPAERSRVSYG